MNSTDQFDLLSSLTTMACLACEKPMTDSPRFKSFSEFYPFYLEEHSDRRCRALHYVGSSLVIATLIYAIRSQQYALLWLLPVIGYGFAWTGHFFFEHNRPATFKYPLYSFLGDWVMLKDFLSGRFRESFPGDST